MKNLAITIPSKGRLHGETFALVAKAKDTPVYVYVNQIEHEAYAEEYPNFNLIPHDKKTINEIRLFIQEHQHSLNNNMLMMDDDIRGFKDEDGHQISINYILRGIKDALEFKPFVYFFHHGQEEMSKIIDNITYGIFTPASAVALSSDLYTQNIRYPTDVISEDFGFYFLLLLNNIDIQLYSYFIDKNTDNAISNFTTEFRNSSIIESYLLYGDVIEMQQDYDSILPNIAGSRIAHYKKHGPVYTPESDRVLQSIKLNEFPGYKLLENWESKFILEEKEEETHE
jgi:hypothetical protein